MKRKNLLITVIVTLAVICTAASIYYCHSKKGNTDNVERVIGYSALYSEELIDKAFDIAEETFEREFEGCTLHELRYDEDVENRFADQLMEYNIENNSELIIVLSEFSTDENGGDGGFNPNDTYSNWQWHMVRTKDKKSWEIISWGY